MAIGVDNDYVFWTVLEKLSPIVADFPAAPYDILIDSDGDQLSQADWNALPSAEDKLEAIYRTVAVNKARKAFGLPSLKNLRYTKNTVNLNFTFAEDITITDYTNQQGGPADGSDVYVYQGKAHQNIELVAGKKYVISFPADYPLRLSTTPDGRGQDSEGNDAVEFTKGIVIDSVANTLTYEVDNFSVPDGKLYYYSTAVAGMGGEINIIIPYYKFEPTLDEDDGLPIGEHEELEDFPVYANDLFLDLTKDDIVIDTDSLPNEINGFQKQDIIDALSYIPTEDTGGVFNNDLTNFIGNIGIGEMFVDSEDAIDGWGNRLEDSESESEARNDPDDHVHVIEQSDGIGPSVLPYDLDDAELIDLQTQASGYWWLRVLYGFNELRMLFDAPTHDKNGTLFYDQKDLKYYSAIHPTKELTQKVDPANSEHKISPPHHFHFDDLHTLLNIKDPAYGVDANGSGGQDLSKLQNIRKCKVISDAGFLYLHEDAGFSVNEVPAGSVYLGSNIIVMPPNSFAEPHYDDCTRLVLWFYGANVTSLQYNNNLAYRILHDFNRKWFSDLESDSIDYPDEYYLPGSENLTIEDVKGLSLTWTNGSNWEDEVPNSLFKLRRRQGGGSGPAFLINGSESFSSTPSYMETTVKASDFGLGGTARGDISFTYRVLSSQCKLNTRVFALERTNTFYTLDGYGFDVNPTPANGISIMNQAYFWFPPPAA